MKNFFREVLLGLALCLGLALAAPAHADLTPQQKLDMLPRFASLHEAAVYGAARLERCSHYYECGAEIATDSAGKFVMSGVTTNYKSDSVRIPEAVPLGFKLVADIHSHPCLPNAYPQVFSPDDIISSITTRTTAYLVDLCTGKVHEFVPGVTKPDEVLIDDDTWLTEGVVIGQVAAFPDEPKAVAGP